MSSGSGGFQSSSFKPYSSNDRAALILEVGGACASSVISTRTESAVDSAAFACWFASCIRSAIASL